MSLRSAFIPVFVAALTPILALGILVVAPTLGLVRWEPPLYWANHFGTASSGTGGQNSVTSIATDPTGVYVAGFTNRSISNPKGQFFLKKYDSAGTQLWDTELAGSNITDVQALSTDGNVLLVTGIMIDPSSREVVFLQKRSIDANLVWTRQLGPGQSSRAFLSSSRAYAVFLDLQSSTATIQNFDLNGNLIWSKTVVNVTDSKDFGTNLGPTGIYLAGNSGVPGTHDTRLFLSEYGPDGSIMWTRQFDQPPTYTCECYVTALSADTGGVYVSGNTFSALPGHVMTGSVDGFVRKYDINGNVDWTNEFGAPYSETFAPALSVSGSGVYLVQAGGAGEHFLRYDFNGNRVWSAVLERLFIGSVAIGNEIEYVGGGTETQEAFVGGFSQNASLIFFGLNPPLSFLAAGGLVVAGFVGILFFRRAWKRNKLRHPSSASREYGSHPQTQRDRPTRWPP